jgi:cyclopropane-fatty-acyl-phospholipid synthase
MSADDAAQVRDAVVCGGVAARLLARVGRRVRLGSLSLVLPDGSAVVLRGDLPGPVARAEIHSWRAFWRILASQAVGLADSYAQGEWDSPDPAAVVELAARNLDLGAQGPSFAWAVQPWRRLRHWLRANTRRGSRRNISFHYDLGNDFYALWLDESMTYSSALFPRPGLTLEQAQDAKYRRLLDSLGSKPGQHILEIGCGWGGLAEIAARDYGLRVTALTLSREQLAYARDRIARAGLADRVDVRLCDYRDVEGRFDHVVSIEMMEAVGEAYWPVYFDRIAACVLPGGRVAIQVITIADELFDRYSRRPDFIQMQVFPGGMLPTGTIVRETADRAGLSVLGDFGFGADYGRTLAEWRARFIAARDDLLALGRDRRFSRLWAFYLAYCEGGFRSGRIDVRQFSFQKAENSR